MTEQDTLTFAKTQFFHPNIRIAVRSDLPAMEWGTEFKHFRAVYANAFARMQQGNTIIWIAETDLHGLIGQVFVQLVCDRPELADGWQRAYLYSFRIKPEFRNQGLGTEMVKTIETFLLERQFNRLTLNVAKDNPDAQRLYDRLGFKIVANEPGVWSYPDESGVWHTQTEPSWRMEKLLRRPTEQVKVGPPPSSSI
jgi:ribosomal protein S18 acetylase RimI-like enzyme